MNDATKLTVSVTTYGDAVVDPDGKPRTDPLFDLISRCDGDGEACRAARAALHALCPKGTGEIHTPDAYLTLDEVKETIERLRGLGHTVKVAPSAARAIETGKRGVRS